jgi:phospholipase/carboxylesterase
VTRDLVFGRRAARSGQAKSLVIFLHGYGANGDDLLGLSDPMAPHLPDTVFIAPDAPEPCRANPYGLQWFPVPWIDGSTQQAAEAGMVASVADLNAFLDERLSQEGLPPSALGLLGFSQGSMMALHAAPRRAEAVAAVVAFSGRLLQPDRLEAEARVRPPVLLIHGDRDPVVPFEDMGTAGAALVQAGFEVYGHVMEDAGHSISPDGLSAALRFLRERLPG